MYNEANEREKSIDVEWVHAFEPFSHLSSRVEAFIAIFEAHRAKHNQVISRKLVLKDQNSRNTDSRISSKESNKHFKKWKNTRLFIEWNLAFDSSLSQTNAEPKRSERTQTYGEKYKIIFTDNIATWFHSFYSKNAHRARRQKENPFERICI